MLRHTLSLFAVIALSIYVVLFWATPFEPYSDILEAPYPRGIFFTQLFFPEEVLASWLAPNSTLAAVVCDRVPILAVTLLTLVVAWGYGFGILRVLGITTTATITQLEAAVFSIALGLGMLGNLVAVIAFVGFAHSFVLFAIIAILGVILALPQIKNAILAIRTVRTVSLSVATIALAILAFSALLILGGMIPSTDYDVLAYHLAAPREIALSGQFPFFADNVYANMPLATEMLGVWGMTLCGSWFVGGMVYKTLVAATAILTALAIAAFGRRFFTPRVGVVAMLLYLATPWVLYTSTVGLIDGVVAMHTFLALAALAYGFTTVPRDAWRWVAVSGLFAGLAAACKYPAVVFVVLPLAVAVIFMSRKHTIIFLCTVFIACGLWYVKNAVFTGNPVYPLLFSVFGDTSGSWNAAVDARWCRVHSPHDFLFTTFFSDFARVALTSPWQSPLIVPLLALLPFTMWRASGAKKIAVWFVVWLFFLFAVWWCCTHRIDRFWLPALPVMSLLAAVGATWCDARWWRVMVATLLTLCVVYGLILVGAVAPGKNNRLLASLASQRDNTHSTTHKHSGLLLVGEAKAFLYEPPVFFSSCFNETPLKQIVESSDPRAALRRNGITHILVDWNEIRRFRSAGNYGFSEFVTPEVFARLVREGILVEEEYNNGVELFRVVKR